MTLDTVCSYMRFDSLGSSLMASISLFLLFTIGRSWDHWSLMSSLSKLLGQSTWPCNSSQSFLQQYTAVHSSTQQYTAIHSSTQQYTAVHSNTQQYTAIHSSTQQYKQYTAVHSNTQQYTAVHSNTQQYTAVHSNTQQYTAVHSSTQQYTAHTTLVQSLFLKHGGEAWIIMDNWNPPMHTFHIQVWTANICCLCKCHTGQLQSCPITVHSL